MSLYQKYRPKEFSEIAGNEEVVSYIQEAVADLEKCPKVFLFHGQTGTGKTTMARIIATYLGCNDFNFIEINTANFRGIDTARELINSSKYHAVGGGSKVWVIDEVHQMTAPAQNSLLKLLEDPPKNCYYILCTTDPHKLLGTIRGRCMELQMSPLDDKEMYSLLRRIVKAEKKVLEKEIYEQIIEDSLGLSRNAIQVLEKVISLPKSKRLEASKKMAGELNQSIELCRALLFEGSSWKKVANILKGLKKQEAEGIRRHVLGYVEASLLKSANDRAALILEEFLEPLYDAGFPGLVLYCYSVIKG